jgi:hypothetical protein
MSRYDDELPALARIGSNSRMSLREKWLAWGRLPLVRQFLFLLGILMIIVSPLVGAIPGPGGIIVFGFGLGLTLKYSEWAKRQYVRFKRAHPNKGRWTDWGLRRPSARRREEIRREQPLDSSGFD